MKGTNLLIGGGFGLSPLCVTIDTFIILKEQSNLLGNMFTQFLNIILILILLSCSSYIVSFLPVNTDVLTS